MTSPADHFLKHGPVRVSADHTYLAHTDGTPFFYLADTAWNGALLSTDADWDTYLNDRAAKGFTAIQFITHAPWTAAMSNLEGQSAFTDPKNHTINEKFFDRIDRRIEAINARGMLAVPVLAWAANFGASRRFNIGHTASAEELIPFIRYQVERFSRHHVMWVLAGDGVYNFWRARKWKRIGRAVFADTRDHAPVSLHPVGRTWPYRSFANETWLDVYGYQSSHTEESAALRWLQSGPPAQYWKTNSRPAINLEPVYEGIAPLPSRPAFDRAVVRRAVCWSLLNAPTAGVAYGAHGLWGWHDGPMEALNHAGMGIGPAWHEAMQFPGSADVGRIGALFKSIAWHTLRPPALESQPGMGDPARFVSSSQSFDGALAVFYLPTPAPITIRIDDLKPNMHWSWFDPRTANRFDASATAAKTFHPPADGDWFLVGSVKM